MGSAESLRRDFKDREDLAAYLREQFPGASSSDGHLSSIRGGSAEAKRRLSEFQVSRYAGTRNFLSGKVSQLSPYIRHGVLTSREVADFVFRRSQSLAPVYKFVQELAWRDYWQRLYVELGDGIWLDREKWKTGLSVDDYREDLPGDISSGRTGLACMDGFARDLVQQGYLHNHARMWLAAYIIHWRRVKWQAGAQWFLIHLVDGDPASNNLSWQWVASTFSSKPYIFNRQNLERYTEGSYCRNCAQQDQCPFDKGYPELDAELFIKEGR